MGQVLIDEDSVDHLALAHETSGDFLDFCVPFDLSIELIDIESSLEYDLAGIVSQVDNHVAPVFGEFGSDTSLENLLDVLLVGQINFIGDFI